MTSGMLVLLVAADRGLLQIPGDPEYMSVVFALEEDSVIVPRCHPSTLQAEILQSGYDLSSQEGRQSSLCALYLKYLPELALISMRPDSGTDLLEGVSPWLRLADSEEINIVIISPGTGPTLRGWVVFAGSGISTDGDQPVGLTQQGLLSTLKILLDLPWAGDRDWGTPAVSVIGAEHVFRGTARGGN